MNLDMYVMISEYIKKISEIKNIIKFLINFQKLVLIN